MSSLLIEQILKSGEETLDQLIEELGLEINYGTGELEDLCQLNYSQINSDKNNPVSNQCRGLILNRKTFDVVARPFPRFFNIEEPNAANINWSNIKVLEKLDGTLVIKFFYNGAWHFATRGSVGASGPVGDNSFTFNQLITKTWNENNYTIYLNPAYTYCLELTGRANKIVCDYPKTELTLLAVINNETGVELDINAFYTNVPTVKYYDIKTLPEITKMLETFSPMEHEGFVIIDNNNNRVKAKSARYVAAHHLRSQCTPRGLLNLIRIGEDAEFLSYFKEFTNQIHDMHIRLDALETELSLFYDEIKNIEIQKEFALEAIKSRCSGALFALRNGRTKSIREFLLNDLHEDKLLNLLGF